MFGWISAWQAKLLLLLLPPAAIFKMRYALRLAMRRKKFWSFFQNVALCCCHGLLVYEGHLDGQRRSARGANRQGPVHGGHEKRGTETNAFLMLFVS